MITYFSRCLVLFNIKKIRTKKKKKTDSNDVKMVLFVI